MSEEENSQKKAQSVIVDFYVIFKKFQSVSAAGLVASGALPLPSAIAAVLGANIGTTGTIWLAGLMVSDGMPTGITKQIALVHTGVNLLMAVALLPFIQPIARFMSKF